jgi:hypothetical protein
VPEQIDACRRSLRRSTPVLHVKGLSFMPPELIGAACAGICSGTSDRMTSAVVCGTV